MYPLTSLMAIASWSCYDAFEVSMNSILTVIRLIKAISETISTITLIVFDSYVLLLVEIRRVVLLVVDNLQKMFYALIDFPLIDATLRQYIFTMALK